MLSRRFCVLCFLCALLLAASSLSQPQPQTSGPRADLGPQATEPRPDFGAVDGKHYVNSYFGFSYRYPEGWKGNAVQASTVGASQYALFTGNPASSDGTDMRYISINADPLPKNTTPKTFIDGALKTFTGPAGGFDALKTNKIYTFGGKQFYRIDLVSKSTPGAPVFYQSQVFMLTPTYAVTFTFMAVNTDDMDTLIRSMESVSFEPGQSAGHATASLDKK
jgi:hypothetical protein